MNTFRQLCYRCYSRRILQIQTPRHGPRFELYSHIPPDLVHKTRFCHRTQFSGKYQNSLSFLDELRALVLCRGSNYCYRYCGGKILQKIGRDQNLIICTIGYWNRHCSQPPHSRSPSCRLCHIDCGRSHYSCILQTFGLHAQHASFRNRSSNAGHWCCYLLLH